MRRGTAAASGTTSSSTPTAAHVGVVVRRPVVLTVVEVRLDRHRRVVGAAMTVEVGAAAVRGEQRREHRRVGEHEHPAGVEQDGVEAAGRPRQATRLADVSRRGAGRRCRCRTSPARRASPPCRWDRGRRCCRGGTGPASASRLIPWAASCSRRRSTIALPDAATVVGVGAPATGRRSVVGGAAPPAAASRATMASRICSGPTPHVDEDDLGGGVVGRATAVAAPATRQSTVAWSRPSSSSTAATVRGVERRRAARTQRSSAVSSGTRSSSCARPGRSAAAGPSRSRTAVIRSISAVRSFMSTAADVVDQTVALLGGQAHVGEDVHPGGGGRRRRRRGGVRVGGVDALHRQGRRGRRRRRTRRSRCCAWRRTLARASRPRVPSESPPIVRAQSALLFAPDGYRISLPGDHRLGSARLVRRRGGLHRLPRRPRPRLPLVVGAGVARPGRRRRRRGLAVLGRRAAIAGSTSPASSSTSTSATSTPSSWRRSRSRPTSCARSPRSTPTTPAARRPG